MSSGWDDQNRGGGPAPDGARPGQPLGGRDEGQYPATPGQSPSGPAYDQGHYGQQRFYAPTPGSYPQPPQQGWGQNPSVYGSPYALPVAADTRSDMLGIIGLGVVFLSTVVLVIVSWFGGQAFGQFILDADASGLYTEEDLINDPLAMEYVRSATGLVLGAVAVCLVGLAGWITSIVATVQRRGRGFGIIGIILGVLSLGIACAAFVAGVLPVLGY